MVVSRLNTFCDLRSDIVESLERLYFERGTKRIIQNSCSWEEIGDICAIQKQERLALQCYSTAHTLHPECDRLKVKHARYTKCITPILTDRRPLIPVDVLFTFMTASEHDTPETAAWLGVGLLHEVSGPQDNVGKCYQNAFYLSQDNSVQIHLKDVIERLSLEKEKQPKNIEYVSERCQIMVELTKLHISAFNSNVSDEAISAIWEQTGLCYESADQLRDAYVCFKDAMKKTRDARRKQDLIKKISYLNKQVKVKTKNSTFRSDVLPDVEEFKALLVLSKYNPYGHSKCKRTYFNSSLCTRWTWTDDDLTIREKQIGADLATRRLNDQQWIKSDLRTKRQAQKKLKQKVKVNFKGRQ